jgi:hypothetical protein
LPLSRSELTRLHPDLWENARAARWDLEAAEKRTFPVIDSLLTGYGLYSAPPLSVAYRPAGSRLCKPYRALIYGVAAADLAAITARLAAAVGPVERVRVVGTADKSTADNSVASTTYKANFDRKRATELFADAPEFQAAADFPPEPEKSGAAAEDIFDEIPPPPKKPGRTLNYRASARILFGEVPEFRAAGGFCEGEKIKAQAAATKAATPLEKAALATATRSEVSVKPPPAPKTYAEALARYLTDTSVADDLSDPAWASPHPQITDGISHLKRPTFPHRDWPDDTADLSHLIEWD